MRNTIVAILLTAVVWSGAVQAESARGMVFHDKNENGVRDAGERGIKGVRVSNGVAVVATDRGGAYEIPVTNDTILFVLKPRNWATPVNDVNISQFFYVHKPAGSQASRFPGVSPTGPLPESVDFPLIKRREPNTFKALFFGDTQVKNQKEIDFLSHDVLEELIGFEAAFAVSLGDLVHDPLNMLRPLNSAMSVLEMPVYNVLGNHDINFDAPNDKGSDETFERVYGPNYYAYDYGPVHFIVVDSVHWDGEKYVGRLGKDQLEFIRNDLAGVDPKQRIVLSMHIPLQTLQDREELYRILEPFPNTLSFGAHWHTQHHLFLDEEDGWQGATPHHHVINVTACGSWWCGFYDERGIPHTTMADGAPNGYSVVTFSGSDYSIRFKGARHPAEYQLKVMGPEVVEEGKTVTAQILANVFGGSERSTVDMRVGDGPWYAMQHTSMPDPDAVRSREIALYFEELKKTVPDLPVEVGLRIARAKDSAHIWAANLPEDLGPGTHVIHVRTTDMFGQTDTAKRIIRVRPSLSN
jgi:hypothetical protein